MALAFLSTWQPAQAQTAEPAPVVTITGPTETATEGGTLTFRLTADPAPTAAITVNLELTQTGHAHRLRFLENTATIEANQETGVFSFKTVADQLDESDSEITVTVQIGTGYTVGTESSATVTVTDDTPAALVLSESALSMNTGGAQAYTVRLSRPPTAPVTVNISGSNPIPSGVAVPISRTTLLFYPDNWEEPQTVVAGNIATATTSARITHSVATGSAAEYASLAPLVVPVTTTAGAGVIFSEFPLSVVPGVEKVFTVRLTQQPATATPRVRVGFSVGGLRRSGITAGATTRHEFDDDNWNTAVNFQFTMNTDADAEYGQIIANYSISNINNADPAYTGLASNSLRLPVVRALSNDATLSALSLTDFITDDAVVLSPAFAAGTTSYTANAPDRADHVNDLVAWLTVAATPTDNAARVKFSANKPEPEPEPGYEVSLDPGSNFITATVTAEDGTTTQDYTITVTRDAQSGGSSGPSGNSGPSGSAGEPGPGGASGPSGASGDSGNGPEFIIYHDPARPGAAARYQTAVELLKDAGASYEVREVTGTEQVDRLAGVSGSVMPRFFRGDPEAEGWGPSEPKVNNGGLRWLRSLLE